MPRNKKKPDLPILLPRERARKLMPRRSSECDCDFCLRPDALDIQRRTLHMTPNLAPISAAPTRSSAVTESLAVVPYGDGIRSTAKGPMAAVNSLILRISSLFSGAFEAVTGALGACGGRRQKEGDREDECAVM